MAKSKQDYQSPTGSPPRGHAGRGAWYLKLAQIYPFHPYRYAEKAGPLGDLVTQPYDKISPAMREPLPGAQPLQPGARHSRRAPRRRTPRRITSTRARPGI